jgi:hypothetical protein
MVKSGDARAMFRHGDNTVQTRWPVIVQITGAKLDDAKLAWWKHGRGLTVSLNVGPVSPVLQVIGGHDFGGLYHCLGSGLYFAI